jgi:hypothetical protein
MYYRILKCFSAMGVHKRQKNTCHKSQKKSVSKSRKAKRIYEKNRQKNPKTDVHRPGSSGTELRNRLTYDCAFRPAWGVCTYNGAPQHKGEHGRLAGDTSRAAAVQGTSTNKNNVLATSGTWLFQFRNRVTGRFQERIVLCFN